MYGPNRVSRPHSRPVLFTATSRVGPADADEIMLHILVLVGVPAVGASTYYVWHAGKSAQLRALRLPEDHTASNASFTSSLGGLVTIVGTYVLATKAASPLVDGGTAAPGKQTIDSVSQFSKLAGPPMVARAGALCLGMYAGGRVSTWLACRGDSVKAPSKAARR